jgi:hypothetical protein
MRSPRTLFAATLIPFLFALTVAFELELDELELDELELDELEFDELGDLAGSSGALVGAASAEPESAGASADPESAGALVGAASADPESAGALVGAASADTESAGASAEPEDLFSFTSSKVGDSVCSAAFIYYGDI